jgi:Terminase large subunit, T4likevirus-type, N-terminal
MTSPDVAPTLTRVVSKEKYFEKIGYQPHPRQKLFHDSKARFKIPVCGRRFGKTVMGAREAEPTLMIPNKRVWIVGPTYDLGEKEFRVIWNDMIIKLGLGREKEVKKAFNKRSGDMYIEFPWGTRIEVRSADRPETLVGDALDYVIMAEAAKHTKETWDRFIRPALADRRGSATFSTTPEGQNWIHDLWQMGRNPLFEEYESWRFPAWENTYVYPGGRNDPEIISQELTMPSEWFMQEIAADFTSFMGKIYSEWDEQVHVQPHKYNPAWKNYIAFDWGFVNPMAAVEFQVDPMDRVHVWRLHYKSHIRLETFLWEMKERAQPDGYKIDLCFGDAADPEAVATVCEKFAPCIADPKSKDNWREGIDLVKGFLKTQTVGEADEFGTPVDEPWLTVDNTCGDLIREFNNYRAAAPTTGKPRNPREDAQKYDDHALDALRYALMHIFKLGWTQSLHDFIDVSEMHQVPSTGYFTSKMSFS